MKGLVFAGCSFTWGQGLYYYSKLPTLKEPAPDTYDSRLVTDAHRRYMATLRYPRLVANHYNTFEVVSNQNSGSEDNSINFLNQVFGTATNFSHLIDETFSYDEIEYIIIQTSQPNRNVYYYVKNNENLTFCINQPETKLNFYEWLFEMKKSSFDDWYKEHLNNMFEKLKKTMQFYEAKGIKTKVLCWEYDYIPLIKSDIWMYNRFIPMVYQNQTYDCIRTLMNENKNLTINNDFEHFETPPKDHHPSLKCHQIMAESVIKKINKDFEINTPAQKNPETTKINEPLKQSHGKRLV